MIKEEMISVVSRDTGYNKNVVSDILESVLFNISWVLSKGDKVQFLGFGTFEPKQRAARTGRNPHTKEAVPIPARIMPVFKPGKNLKKQVMKERVRDNAGKEK